MIKRKGQIVSRSVIRFESSKDQRNAKYGVDVYIVGKKVTALSNDGPAFYVETKPRRMKNGTFKKCSAVTICNISVSFPEIEGVKS